MKYTAEEARAIAKRLHDDITVADGDALMASDMLTAYAARIEADEMAADYPECSGDPASCPENEGFGCCKAHAEAITLHPPAQAAQGETACPKCGATNPEDAATRCCPDEDSCPGCEEPLAQAWDRKAAQPAQSVDIEAIREVIAYLKKGYRFDAEMADKLTAALPESKP